MTTVLLTLLLAPALQQGPPPALRPFTPADVFQLEYADDPQLSPDGARVAYVRCSMDVMSDRLRRSLWLVELEGGAHLPLVASGPDASSPRWSPDGERLAYVAAGEHGPELWVRHLAGGETAVLTRLDRSPSGLAWSPDGSQLAFRMLVPEEREPMVRMPPRPEGAEWAPEARVIESLNYRADGEGYLETGWRQLFVVPATGGTPRRLTDGPHHAGEPAWTPDGAALVFSSNRGPDSEREPQESELFELDLASGELRALTDRRGPDHSPVVSPDGSRVAFLGHDDRRRGHHVENLYVLERATGSVRRLADRLDRSLSEPRWSADGRAVYALFDSAGETRLARIPLGADPEVLAGDVGGTTLGRPYASGAYTVAAGKLVYTATSPERPADLVLAGGEGFERRPLTDLNGDLLAHRDLARVEELAVTSSADGRPVQAWLALPPGFDPARRYPLVLEIHGGPYANYGPRFAAEVQLYAAAGTWCSTPTRAGAPATARPSRT